MSFSVNPQFYDGRKVARVCVYASFVFVVQLAKNGSMQLSIIIVLYFPVLDGFYSTIRQSCNVPCPSISY